MLFVMVNVRSMTKEALLSAFAGESMAHMRCLVFAEIAEKDYKLIKRYLENPID